MADSDRSRPDKPSTGAKETAPSRLDKILSAVGWLCGAFTLAVFGSYFVKITVFPEGTLPVVACLLVFAWLAIPFVLRRPLRRALNKAYLPLKAAWVFTLAAFTVTFACFLAYIFAPLDETPYDELPDDPVVVVFGAKVNANGAPGTPLARRLYKAEEILKARPDALVVASGGKGDDEPVSEAEAMRRHLVAAGIDESRIIVEDGSHNTLQNIKNTRELLAENGLSDRTVVCVSSDFHVARIRFISERTDGFGDYYYRAGGLRKWDWEYFGVAREYLSFARLLILGTDG